MSSSTIPAIASGATYLEVSMSWIDNEEREYSDAFRIDPAPTDAEVQALVTAAQAASNASSWKCELRTVFEGTKDAANADANAHESVRDKIRLSYKALATGAYQQAYVPAPLTALVGDGGVVDTSNALYTNWKSAIDAIIQTGFSALNTEFVEYQGRNTTTSP